MSEHLMAGVVALGLLGLGGWLLWFSATGEDVAVTGAPRPYRRATRALGIDESPRAMRGLWMIAGAVSLLVGLLFGVAVLLHVT